MKIVEMSGNTVRYITPWAALDDVPPFDDSIVFLEVPDDVTEGMVLIDGEFVDAPPITPVPSAAPTLTDVMDALRVAFGGTGDVRPAGGDAE